MQSFQLPHGKQQLTVGARALCKHCHRSSSGWWLGKEGEELKGSEGVKNERAKKVLERVLSEAVWINVHSLPPELPALEVRTADGYGARWVLLKKKSSSTREEEEGGGGGEDSDRRGEDGGGPEVEFRGFLEPQMDQGHEKGWRH